MKNKYECYLRLELDKSVAQFGMGKNAIKFRRFLNFKVKLHL